MARERRRNTLAWAAAAMVWGAAGAWGTVAWAGEWPQILGPQRNGKAQGERLADAWPAAGPKVVWSRDVGSGFSGVAAAGGKALLFHRVEDQEWIEAHDPATGKVLWKQGFATQYQPQFTPDNGPRCVPVVHDGRVYLMGGGGNLHCVALNDGKALWSRKVYQELDAPDGYFGAGSSPLVAGDKLLLNVGGREAGVAAFDLKTGELKWKSTRDAASYSSPVLADFQGRSTAVFITRLHLVGLDPASGAERFRTTFGARGPTVNGANPTVLGEHIFATASYGVGALWAKVTPDGLERVWENDDVLSSQYTTCVERNGLLYGIHGRQDIGTASLRCIDPTRGKVLWNEENFGQSTLILVDDQLLITTSDGQLVVASADPEKYVERRRARLFNATVQALPTLSNGLLYLRDGQTLKCFQVGPAR